MHVVDYERGAELEDATFAWTEPDGTSLIDFSTGFTFTLEVGVLAAGFTWLTKTSGISGAATDPNIVIEWTDAELAQVPTGTWTCRLTATRTSDSRDYRMLFMLRVTELEAAISARPCGAWPAVMPCELPGELAIPTRNMALLVATQILWALSGRRFGTCTTTIRPGDRGSCTCGVPDDLWLLDGRGVGAWPAGGGSWPYGRFWAVDTGPGRKATLRLPHGRVAQVHEVVVDGAPLDPSAYRVDDWRNLVRVDGETWPDSQDWTVSGYEPGVFSVTYTYGRAVPQAGLLACGFLACEIAKLMLRQPCELPMRVQSASQGGMNVAFMDPQDFLDKGRTGLYFVDLFLKTYNPNKLQHRSRVFRADRKPGHRVTGTS